MQVTDGAKCVMQMLDSGKLLRLSSLLGAARGGVATVVGAVLGGVGAAAAAAGGWLGGARDAVRAKVSGVRAAYTARRAPAAVAAPAVDTEEPPADADLLKGRDRHPAPAASGPRRQRQMANGAPVQGVTQMAAEDAQGVNF
jgi:hypothetical protein